MIVADAVGADAFESLAVLHTALLALKQEPPRLFNAPRVVLDLAAGAGECARAELRCAKGDKDAFARFAAALDKTRERAVNKSRANPEDDFDLRELRPSPSLSLYPSILLHQSRRVRRQTLALVARMLTAT